MKSFFLLYLMICWGALGCVPELEPFQTSDGGPVTEPGAGESTRMETGGITAVATAGMPSSSLGGQVASSGGLQTAMPIAGTPRAGTPQSGGDAQGGMRPPVGGVSLGGHMGGAQTAGGRTGPSGGNPAMAGSPLTGGQSQSGGVALGGVATGGTPMGGGTPMSGGQPLGGMPIHGGQPAGGGAPVERCGDGVVQNGEECDDGNQVDVDLCTSDCRLARCPDGLVQAMAGEACDDGNLSNTDACLSNCVAATCGDGFVREGVEECDSPTDLSCTSTCRAVCDLSTNEGCFGLTPICIDLGANQGRACSPCIHARDLVIDPGCGRAQPICIGHGPTAQCVQCRDDLGCMDPLSCVAHVCGTPCEQGPSNCDSETVCGQQIVTNMCLEQIRLGVHERVCAPQPKMFFGLAPRADGIGRTCDVNREEVHALHSHPAECEEPQFTHLCGGCEAGYEGTDCNRVAFPFDENLRRIDTLKAIDVNGDQHDDVVLLQNGRIVIFINNGGQPSTWVRVESVESDVLALGAGRVVIDDTEQTLIIAVRPHQNQNGPDPETVKVYSCAFVPSAGLLDADHIDCDLEELLVGANPLGMRPTAVEVGRLDWNLKPESTDVMLALISPYRTHVYQKYGDAQTAIFQLSPDVGSSFVDHEYYGHGGYSFLTLLSRDRHGGAQLVSVFVRPVDPPQIGSTPQVNIDPIMDGRWTPYQLVSDKAGGLPDLVLTYLPNAPVVDGQLIQKRAVRLNIMEDVEGPVLDVQNASPLPDVAGVLQTTWWSRVANESPGKERGRILFGTAEGQVVSISNNRYAVLADGLGAPVVDLATLELYPGHRNELVVTRARGGGPDRLYLINSSVPRSCRVIHDGFPENSRPADGIYFLQPKGFVEPPRAIYCDMHNGGWTQIMRGPATNLTGPTTPHLGFNPLPDHWMGLMPELKMGFVNHEQHWVGDPTPAFDYPELWLANGQMLTMAPWSRTVADEEEISHRENESSSGHIEIFSGYYRSPSDNIDCPLDSDGLMDGDPKRSFVCAKWRDGDQQRTLMWSDFNRTGTDMCRWPNGVGGIYTSCAPNEDPDNHKYFSVFVREPACGDGVRSTDEICDILDAGETDWRHDNEDKPGRGYRCNDSCQSECPAIRKCEDGEESNCCGNGKLDVGEECDVTLERESVGITEASICNPETCTETRPDNIIKLRNSIGDNGPLAGMPADSNDNRNYSFTRQFSELPFDDSDPLTKPYVRDSVDKHIVVLGESRGKCFELTVEFRPYRYVVGGPEINFVEGGPEEGWAFACPNNVEAWETMARRISVTNLDSGERHQRGIPDDAAGRAKEIELCMLKFPSISSSHDIEIQVSPKADACTLGAYQIKITAVRVGMGACR